MNFKKSVFAIILVISLIISVFTFNVSAASASVSGGGNYNVGQKVTVRINYNAGVNITTAEFTITYDPAILTLTGVSGAQYNGSNGSIKIVDDDLSDNTKKVSTSAYTLTFSAVAQGSSSVSVSGFGVSEATLEKLSASASANISVTKPAPSSNANLASLRLSSGTLSPGFSANTTKYTAIVKNGISKITLSAGVANGGATLVGAGTFDLKEGDNTRTVTVTAADGKTKKSYTVTIKRLTADETKVLEEQERANDPLLVVVDGADYHIMANISAIAVPEGFTLSTVNRRDTDIGVHTDTAGKYTIFYLTADADANITPVPFTRDENDNFKALPVITVNGKLYIVEEPSQVNLQKGFYKTSYTLTSGKVIAFASDDSRLKDFYWLYCYADGESAFYCFDSAKGTIQRAPAFEAKVSQVSEQSQDNDLSIIEAFLLLKTSAKIIIGVIALLLASIITVVVLFIARASKKKKSKEAKSDIFTSQEFDEIDIMDNSGDLPFNIDIDE